MVNINSTKKQVMHAVSKNGYVLQYASAELRADKQVVMCAVRNAGYSLCYVDESLRDDKEVVMGAVMNAGYSLCYAGAMSCNDRELVLVAIEQDVDSQNLMSTNLRHDLKLAVIAQMLGCPNICIGISIVYYSNQSNSVWMRLA